MNSKTQSALITDEQSLVGASMHEGRVKIPVYDDGWGELYIHRDSMGISGIVRAQSWEDAYSICEDEFFPDCDLTMDEIVKEYGFKREHVRIVRSKYSGEECDDRLEYHQTMTGILLPDWEFIRWETRETPDAEAWSENELFCEAYGFRPNGLRHAHKPMSYIYAKDLNGDSLEVLTPSLLAELGIALQIKTNE